MPQIIPELSAYVDSRRQAITRQLADALSNPTAKLAQMAGNQQYATNAQNAQTISDLAQGNYADLAKQADQGAVNAVPGGAGVIADAATAARQQLLPSQLPVFERIFASTGDANTALTTTKQLTNLLGPQPSPADLLNMVRGL